MPNASPAPREDQRVRITKGMLQNAFVSLLAEKPVQAITVKELCARAGVNRGTFYLHYQDIYDLLETMEGEMLADLEHLLRENPVIVGEAGNTGGGFIQAIFQFFEKNREMCAILLGDNGDKKFVARIIDMGRAKSVREYRELYPQVDERGAEMYYAFVAWGFLGLLQYAINNPGLPMEELAASAEKIITGSAQFFA